MRYNIAEYVIGWRFIGQHGGETMADLSQTVFVRSNDEAFKRTNTHIHTHSHIHKLIRTHTPKIAIGENAICCISLKIRL